MNYILFDDDTRFRLLPFTHTRPIADIRCGILTMRERWERMVGQKTSTLTDAYLQPVFHLEPGDDNLLINASVFATPELVKSIAALKPEERLVQDGLLLAARFSNAEIHFHNLDALTGQLTAISFTGTIHRLRAPWDIFTQNERALREDFALITEGRKSAALPDYATVLGKENVFLEEGAVVGAGVIINATAGYVYIGREAELMEGVMLRGSVALCDHAVLKMGAKVYGATTIGPGCKAGGEIGNTVFFANSNKGHDGFVGNAVIGEWCNLGADTNCSNLKNNYDYIKIWDEHNNRSVQTGLQFCGLLMGDHSKCGINTMFNTGTVVGVSANIFGGDFPEKFIPSFTWGGSEGMVSYDFSRAMETAKRMMARRNLELQEQETIMLRHIFDATAAQRQTFTKG